VGTSGADRQSRRSRARGRYAAHLEGEQLPGEGRFEADGTFTLAVQAAAGAADPLWRYSYANGVCDGLDRFEVREALHW